MEQQKIDKRSKEYKALTIKEVAPQQHPDDLLDTIIKNGIPVWKATFQAAVNNGDEVPENYFSNKSILKSRHVEMWLCSGGQILICRQKTKTETKVFCVPAANCIKMYFN